MSDFKNIITAVSLAGTLILTGCDSDKPKIIDKTLGLSRSDYTNLNKSVSRKEAAEKSAKKEDGEKKDSSDSASSSEPPIPEVSPIVSSPAPPKAGDELMVSLSVTDDVPLSDVLLELARLASVDLEMDGGITGGIIFKAHNRPFSEVIERVCEMAKLRYKLADGVLRVEVDNPYVQNYPIDFLNIERSSTSSVTVNTNVLSGESGSSSSGSSGSSSSASSSSSSGSSSSSSGGLNSGSNSTITAKAESDLWKSFEEGIKQILQDNPVKPEVKTTQQGAGAQGNQPNAQDAGPKGGGPAARPGKGGSGNVEPMQATVQANNQNSSSNKPGEAFYVINKQAGVVTVKATSAQHKKIAEYIQKLKASASSQVLIEAKIVEVTLNKDFQSGINWSTLFENAGYGVDVNFNDFDTSVGTNLATFSITEAAGLNLDAAVRLTEEFGTSRTLSSPRLTAINNQPAVLTFAKNQVYFEINVERETNSSSSNNQQLLTVDSNVKTVPIGIILNILPSIDLTNNEVLLNVRPTLSRVESYVDDPAVAFLATQASSSTTTIPSNQIPIVEVREIDSMLKIKSGQIMVIGGLMEDKASNTDKGLPGVNTIPVVGNLFKSKNNSDTMSELVIFIKATIVPSRTSVHPYDKELYNKFTSDPRPLNF